MFASSSDRSLGILVRRAFERFSVLVVVLAVSALAGAPGVGAQEPDPNRVGEASAEGSPSGEDPASARQEDSAREDGARGLDVYEEVTVRERADDLVGLADSATEGSTGRADLAHRPRLRIGEMVETIPGLIATQHSGGGKANQYFLRGFNLDHGTDLAMTVAGIRVNMPSHAHSQGYSDLNFVIPEIIERVRYRKGPYFAERGDFAAAGAVDLDIVRALPQGMVRLEGGSFGFARALVADSLTVSGGDLTFAADVTRYDGPWDRGNEEDLFKGAMHYERGDATRGFSLTAMAYDGSWLSTDQVPLRAVESGLIGRFGLIDDGPRGSTERFSLYGELHRGSGSALSQFEAYLMAYDFSLVTNSTYFLDDPENGDQIRQADSRVVTGLGWNRHWSSRWAGRWLEHSAGLAVRVDDIDNGLFRTRYPETLRTVRSDDILQLTGGPWISSTLHWKPWLRTTLGLRLEGLYADVDADREANSGTIDDTLFLPKLGVVLGPWASTELYLNLGYAHHSNDVRGATARIDPATGLPTQAVPALVRAKGADVGLRTTALDGLQTTVSMFVLELDSELVFVGDAASAEPNRPSRRSGVELANFYQIDRYWSADFDVTWTDAEFTDPDPAGDQLPNSIETTVAAGVSLSDFHGWSAALRWRSFHDIPLVEDGSVVWGSTSLLNARLAYELPIGLRVDLDVFNLLDSEDDDIRYFFASRLPGEPAAGAEDVHFHPLEERGARLAVTWRFGSGP